MRTVTLKLPEAQAELLERKARALGRSKSALIRQAVQEVLSSGQAGSCHDLMQAHCGSWKNTPRDFATNKKYLKGFGG
jgi:hypothetical protein